MPLRLCPVRCVPQIPAFGVGVLRETIASMPEVARVIAEPTRRKSGTGWQDYNDLAPPTLLEKRFYENYWARLFWMMGGSTVRLEFRFGDEIVSRGKLCHDNRQIVSQLCSF